jgi:hypothetical protein
MDNSAITPDNQPFIPPMTEAPVDEAQAEAEALDKQLGDIVHHPAWDRIEAMMQERIEEFKTLRSADMAHLSLDQVGQKFLVARMVAEELELILNRVRSAAEADKANEQAKSE